MIYMDDLLQGADAMIGDDYIKVPGVGRVIGITDWYRHSLRDDSNGAEITAAVLAGLRKRRDELLTACDWTQIPDVPLSAEQRTAWQVYRQVLRDLPEMTQLVPGGIIWPVPPAQEREG